MSLSETARAILVAATNRPSYQASAPETLPVAAQRSVVLSMIKNGLLLEVAADDDQQAWRTGNAGERFALRATEAGIQAVAPAAAALVPAEIGTKPLVAATPAPNSNKGSRAHPLRTAAVVLLATWDEPGDNRPDLSAAIDALRDALIPKGATVRQPRPDTKRATILAMLRRPEGATVAQVAEATGWARHTVHGFFAGLKKAGTRVEVLERVRQVGPGKQGAAGSYTVYRTGEAG